MTKGQRSPYDSAVAVEINQYRLEGRKFKAADSTIIRQQKSLQLQAELIELLQKETRFLIQQTRVQKTYIKETNDNLLNIQQSINELKQADNPPKFPLNLLSNVRFLVPAAFFLGVLVAK